VEPAPPVTDQTENKIEVVWVLLVERLVLDRLVLVELVAGLGVLLVLVVVEH
jgi:hypothetical protein